MKQFETGESVLLVRVEGKGACVLPLFDVTVPAGFPSPAADYMEEEIDLEGYLRPRPLSTFIVKVQGDSMVGACIPSGALLVVDKSLKPSHGQIVLAVLNGEFTVKRFVQKGRSILLEPANPDYPTIAITEEMDFVIWGVVTKVIIDTVKVA